MFQLSRIGPDAGIAEKGVHGPGGFVLAGEEGDPGLLEEVQGGADGRAGNRVPDHRLVVFLGQRTDNLRGIHQLPD